MKFITVGGKDYIVRKQFKITDVADEKGLNELKWMYLADTMLKSKDKGVIILGSEITDAEIIEETDNSAPKEIEEKVEDGQA